MSRRNLYIIIGVLVLVVIGAGYAWYQSANTPAPAVSINTPAGNVSVGADGVKVETTTPAPAN